jgi:hypothetical protein
VTVRAAGPGRGVPRRLTYCWKIDGGECKSEKEQDTLELPPGRHKVILVVEDPAWGTSASETHEVQGS